MTRTLLGYGWYDDDFEHIGCPRAKSPDSPCCARDGHMAVADDGRCVGCGEWPAKLLGALVREVVRLGKAMARSLPDEGSTDGKEAPPAGRSGPVYGTTDDQVGAGLHEQP